VTKFAFDANVIIGFYNIGHLKEILKKLEELDDRVYIDEKNYYEALIHHTAQKKTLLGRYRIFEVITSDEEKFKFFRQELSTNGINLQGDDRYVPYVGKIKMVNYLVTSDETVLKKTQKIRKYYKINYMEPITNVNLVTYLYSHGKLKLEEYAKIILEYFKYEEMRNIYRVLKRENCDWDEKDIIHRVQWYKDPLLDALAGRVSGAQTKVKMYE